MTKTSILEELCSVIDLETDGLRLLKSHIDDRYAEAVQMLLQAKGKIITTGMGKSTVVARKTASTLSSTGTLAVFLHPTEALHGDLGIVAKGDVILAFSKSGESDELSALLPAFAELGARIIAVTGYPKSTLARGAHLVLETGLPREACPHDLAPTSSIVAAIAVGDALAMTLMKLKNFKPKDFAAIHPGGKLGRRLKLQVQEILVPLEKCFPLDPRTATLEDCMLALSRNLLGVVLFSQDGKSLDGILTDGDLRRALSHHKARIFSISLSEIINTKPTHVEGTLLASAALEIMENRERPLNVLPVLSGGQLKGVIRLHELVRVV